MRLGILDFLGNFQSRAGRPETSRLRHPVSPANGLGSVLQAGSECFLAYISIGATLHESGYLSPKRRRSIPVLRGYVGQRTGLLAGELRGRRRVTSE